MIKIERLKQVLFLLICISIIFVTGCGDKYPPKEEEVLSYIEEKFGDSYKLMSKETKADTEYESGITLYHFQSEFGFYFDVESGLSYTPPSLFPAHYSKYCYTDYMKKLQEFIADDIKNLVDRYSSEQIKITTEDSGNIVNVNLERYSNIRTVNEFVSELGLLYHDKYRVKDKALSDINITIYKDDKRFYSNQLSWLRGGESEKDIEYLQLRYLELIREGEINDSSIDEEMLTNKPRLEIDKLVINGEQYTSKKYEPQFLYSIDEQEWLTLVGYGIILDYNGYVRDYMQREIIIDYLDGEYDIDDKNSITRYSIGNDSYEVYFPLDTDTDGIKEDYYFKKNNQNLDIKLCEAPRDYTTKATYFAYIKLSDWAELLNMNYIVDNKEGVVILNSK